MTPETEPDTFVLSADDATIARQEPVYEAPDVDKQPDARVASQMSAIDARTDSVRR